MTNKPTARKSHEANDAEEKLDRYHSSLPEEQRQFFAEPSFNSTAEERRHRKERLAGAFRLFDQFGFNDGVAGHISVRDPELTDHFWVNPLAVHFSQICVSDLVLVDKNGRVVEGERPVNPAAFAIHGEIHISRPEVLAVAHAHSVYGRAWSSLGRLLEPITQDACAFFEDHIVFDYEGPAVSQEEGKEVAAALGPHKAAILANHGLLTVGQSVEECVWWFISMERCCQVQLTAEGGGEPRLITDDVARSTRRIQGNHDIGRFNFRPLWDMIARKCPDLFD